MDTFICRTCMNELAEPTKITPLFKIYKNVYHLPNMIAQMIPVQIKIDDNFSKVICQTCANKITDFFGFYQMCIKSDCVQRQLRKKEIEINVKTRNHVVNCGNESCHGGESFSAFHNVTPIADHQRCNDTQHHQSTANHASTTPILLKANFNEELKFEVSKSNVQRRSSCHSESNDSFHMQSKHTNPIGTLNTDFRIENKNFSNDDERSRQFICDICDKAFESKDRIRIHLRRHSQSKALCNACGKWLSRNNLSKHYRAIHLNEKKFECSICQHRFTSSFRLRNHVNSHKGIRAYSCEICSNQFFTSSAAKRHMATVHTNEKRFVCCICSKAFNRKTNLKTHMFAHTGKYEHVCPVCCSGFRRKRKLVDHLKLCKRHDSFN